jgi:hypothetical protein
LGTIHQIRVCDGTNRYLSATDTPISSGDRPATDADREITTDTSATRGSSKRSTSEVGEL